jgi:hypothetical protein
MSEGSSANSTSLFNVLLGIVNQMHYKMETGMEVNTMQWGERILDLSKVMHSYTSASESI